MPIFFFDTFDGEREIRDVDGLEFANGDAVRRAAIEGLPDLARELLLDSGNRTMKVTVRNAEGQYVYEAVLVFRDRWLGEDAE